jgi:hypothetical protein
MYFASTVIERWQSPVTNFMHALKLVLSPAGDTLMRC